MPVTNTRIKLNPFNIGPITIDPPLVLAPMVGQTNHADCGLVCTELISSPALRQKGSREHTLERFDWRASESPFAVQLFGSDPALMADAACLVVDRGADIVDINMGCWVPKVAKKGRGAGAALLRDLDKAAAVVQAVVDAVEVPVTVKVRSGWERDNPTAIPFAVAAEAIGVQAITVHARFAEQGFTGEADWTVIREVKEAVRSIPVIGNGDLYTAADVIEMLETTGCDGVMIGRAALGNPWIFRQIAHEIRTGMPLPPPTQADRARMALRQARLTLETTHYPAIKAVRELRGQLLKYVTDFPDATTIRENIVRAQSRADFEAIFAPFL
jgi:tRNA-dihydrouridine synthase B